MNDEKSNIMSLVECIKNHLFNICSLSMIKKKKKANKKIKNII